MRPPSDDSLARYGFALDGPGDDWLSQLREAEASLVLGRIGPYELEEEIDRGGQGVVFRARQVGSRRLIALKRPLAGSLATESMRRRFRREVEAAARLDHPNIVRVHGMDVVDGTPIFAMEWIDGVPATEWSVGRDVREVLRLFLSISRAVSHAHGRGVLHRDLKPSNVLVDARGEPHVLDFGLAKHGAGADGLSKSAEAFGTPAYASPEQLSGKALRLDARTDVYSLGVLLYEMLTGESPYGDWDGVAELLRRVERARAPRVSRRVRGAGVELDTILRTALAHDREHRYRSVELLAADVRSHLAGEPIRARPMSSLAACAYVARRNPVVTGLAAALVLVSLGFGLHAARQAERLRAERDTAVLRAEQLGALLGFVPDCIHRSGSYVPAIVKPETVIDTSVAYSSPNPYLEESP